MGLRLIQQPAQLQYLPITYSGTPWSPLFAESFVTSSELLSLLVAVTTDVAVELLLNVVEAPLAVDTWRPVVDAADRAVLCGVVVTSEATGKLLLALDEAPMVADVVGLVVDTVDVMVLCGVVMTTGVTGELLLAVDEELIVVDAVGLEVGMCDVVVLCGAA